MANLANLLATIAANVYTNHNNEVTAQMVKDALGAIVSTMGQGGYIYKGLATTSTNPNSPDANVFYIATAAGTYTNFDGIVVNAGEVAILKGTGTSWSKDVTGAATAAKLTELEQKVDGLVDIAVSATSNSWRLTGTGSCTSDVTARMRKFLVTAGDLLYLKLSKDTAGVYQFQNAASVSSSDPNTALIGLPQTEAIDGIVKVPTGATYLIISELLTNTTNKVQLANNIKAELTHKIDETAENASDDLWDKFSHTNLNASGIDSYGYLQLNRTIPAGTPCKVKLAFNPWGVYTNIYAYTTEGGTSQKIYGPFYTFNNELSFTPSIDVNFIRIDSSAPGAGASGSILIRSAVNYTDRIDFDAFVKQMDDIIYIGQPIAVSGIPGYTAIGSTLLAGHKYRIDYAIHNYGNQFYYATLYSDPNGGVSAGSIVSGSAISDIEGSAEITLTRNAQSIRIGVGSGTLPDNAQATFTIREVSQFADKIYVDGKVAEVESQLSSGYAVLADFFDTEMQNTIDSVNALTNQRCLVMPIVTDTHWRWTTAEGNSVKERSINNVRYFCERVYADGVSHLGDILDTGVLTTETDDELYDLMQQYLMSLASSNRHFYAANGNHDGASLGYFNEMKWYGIIGRATANEPDVTRYQTTPYFYIDHEPTKVRCIFLANPDNVTGDATYWGFSQRELEWLEDEALVVPDGYSVIFFTHIPPVSGYADSAANLADFASLCTDFNANHTGKVLAVICGHEHIDSVIPVGWTFTGGYSNTLPCPIVILGANYYNLGTTDRTGTWDGIIYGRNVGTATEDLWTILVYTPDDANDKLHFIRFGAGADVDI